jgi:hypothetical protein
VYLRGRNVWNDPGSGRFIRRGRSTASLVKKLVSTLTRLGEDNRNEFLAHQAAKTDKPMLALLRRDKKGAVLEDLEDLVEIRADYAGGRYDKLAEVRVTDRKTGKQRSMIVNWSSLDGLHVEGDPIPNTVRRRGVRVSVANREQLTPAQRAVLMARSPEDGDVLTRGQVNAAIMGRVGDGYDPVLLREQLTTEAATIQSRLKALGYTHVRLYRATPDPRDPFLMFTEWDGPGTSSWTTDRSVAEQFANAPAFRIVDGETIESKNVVVEYDIPIEQILLWDAPSLNASSVEGFGDEVLVAKTPVMAARLARGDYSIESGLVPLSTREWSGLDADGNAVGFTDWRPMLDGLVAGDGKSVREFSRVQNVPWWTELTPAQRAQYLRYDRSRMFKLLGADTGAARGMFDATTDEQREVFAARALASFHATQTFTGLREQGITHVRLYRGTTNASDPLRRESGSGITSWTTDPTVAAQYDPDNAGSGLKQTGGGNFEVVEMLVPVEQIIAWDAPGLGGARADGSGGEVLVAADVDVAAAIRDGAGPVKFGRRTTVDDVVNAKPETVADVNRFGFRAALPEASPEAEALIFDVAASELDAYSAPMLAEGKSAGDLLVPALLMGRNFDPNSKRDLFGRVSPTVLARILTALTAENRQTGPDDIELPFLLAQYVTLDNTGDGALSNPEFAVTFIRNSLDLNEGSPLRTLLDRAADELPALPAADYSPDTRATDADLAAVRQTVDEGMVLLESLRDAERAAEAAALDKLRREATPEAIAKAERRAAKSQRAAEKAAEQFAGGMEEQLRTVLTGGALNVFLDGNLRTDADNNFVVSWDTGGSSDALGGTGFDALLNFLTENEATFQAVAGDESDPLTTLMVTAGDEQVVNLNVTVGQFDPLRPNMEITFEVRPENNRESFPPNLSFGTATLLLSPQADWGDPDARVFPESEGASAVSAFAAAARPLVAAAERRDADASAVTERLALRDVVDSSGLDTERKVLASDVLTVFGRQVAMTTDDVRAVEGGSLPKHHFALDESVREQLSAVLADPAIKPIVTVDEDSRGPAGSRLRLKLTYPKDAVRAYGFDELKVQLSPDSRTGRPQWYLRATPNGLGSMSETVDLLQVEPLPEPSVALQVTSPDLVADRVTMGLADRVDRYTRRQQAVDRVRRENREALVQARLEWAERTFGGDVPDGTVVDAGSGDAADRLERLLRAMPSGIVEQSGPVQVSTSFNYWRAHYRKGQRGEVPSINVLGDVSDRVLLHEWGHHAEDSFVELRGASFAFHKWRTGNVDSADENARWLGSTYDSYERAIRDEFFHPYAGKIYPTRNTLNAPGRRRDVSSEIITMGLEGVFMGSTHPDANGVSQGIDDEHAAFTLGWLAWAHRTAAERLRLYGRRTGSESTPSATVESVPTTSAPATELNWRDSIGPPQRERSGRARGQWVEYEISNHALELPNGQRLVVSVEAESNRRNTRTEPVYAPGRRGEGIELRGRTVNGTARWILVDADSNLLESGDIWDELDRNPGETIEDFRARAKATFAAQIAERQTSPAVDYPTTAAEINELDSDAIRLLIRRGRADGSIPENVLILLRDELRERRRDVEGAAQ